MVPDPRECFERVPADAVEVGDLHHGVVVVDKVVRVPRAAVGADVKIGVTTRFPIAPVAWQLGGFDPVALLEAHDLHPRFGQAPSDRASEAPTMTKGRTTCRPKSRAR